MLALWLLHAAAGAGLLRHGASCGSCLALHPAVLAAPAVHVQLQLPGDRLPGAAAASAAPDAAAGAAADGRDGEPADRGAALLPADRRAGDERSGDGAAPVLDTAGAAGTRQGATAAGSADQHAPAAAHAAASADAAGPARAGVP